MAIIQNGNTFILENDFMKRVINTSNGISTQTYHIKPGGKRNNRWYPVFSFEADSPFEAAVIINGNSYEACPHKRKDNRLWNIKGAFDVQETKIIEKDTSSILEIHLVGNRKEIREIALVIYYEIHAELPFISKYVAVKNLGQDNVVVNNITPEITRFFDRRLPLSSFTNYYWDTKKEDPYYMAWTRFEFPEDIDYHLTAGETLESFTVYEAATSMDRQEESFLLHQVIKHIAPWIKNLTISLCINTCKTTAELYEALETAAENQVESVDLHVSQLFDNIGDYRPRRDLFPNGYDDIKKLVAAFHAKGIIVYPYCSTTIAWRSSWVCLKNANWQYLGPNGIRYSPEGFGNMCYQSPWGEYITEKLMFLLEDIGFDGLALDGPYHGLPCEDENHKHSNPESVRYRNWRWEKEFFGEVVAMGKKIKAPQAWAGLLLGLCKTPGGYREEDQNEMGGMDLVTMTRATIYEARYETPACAVWGSFNLEPYHNHSMEASEENPATYEHSIAGLAGYGLDIGVYGKKLFIGPETEKIYHKWVSFLKKYKETLLGEFIHLSQPNGYEPDGVMHANKNAEIPAIVVLFNVCGEEKTMNLSLPLHYAGFAGNTSAQLEGKLTPLDSLGNALVSIPLQPYEVKYIEINRK